MKHEPKQFTGAMFDKTPLSPEETAQVRHMLKELDQNYIEIPPSAAEFNKQAAELIKHRRFVIVVLGGVFLLGAGKEQIWPFVASIAQAMGGS